MELAKSIGRNTLFGVGEKVVQIGLHMVVISVIVHYVGVGGYGIWEIFTTIMSYMMAGVGGAGSALQKYVAEATGTGDYERASERMTAGLFIVFVISAVTLLPLACFSEKLSSMLDVPQEYESFFRNYVPILALAMIWSNVGAVYGSKIMGAHRIDLVKIIDTICAIGRSLTTIVLLILRFGLEGMAMALVSWECLRAMLLFFLSSRILQQVNIAVRFLSYTSLKETLGFAGGYQVYNFLEIAYGGLLTFFILRFFNPEITGIYALSRKLLGFVNLISEAFLLPFLSGAAWVYSQGKTDEFTALFSKSIKFTLTVLIPPLAFLCIFGRGILFGLTGRDTGLFTTGLIILSAGIVPFSVARLFCATYRAAGGTYSDIFWVILKVAVLITFFLPATQIWHYNGALLSYLITEMVGFLFILFAIRREIFNIRLLSWGSDLLRIALLSLLVCGASSIALWIRFPVWISERVLSLMRVLVGSGIWMLVGSYVLLETSYLTEVEKKSMKAIFRSLRLNPMANRKE